MAVQRKLFGRLLPPLTSRRIARLLAAITVFSVFALVVTLPRSVPNASSLDALSQQVERLSKAIPSAELSQSKLFHPFRTRPHPPQQENSTDGDSSWHTHWNWLKPFSSTITLDEDRSVLPPLDQRPPIYTYYDNTLKKDAAVKDAERDLLLTWRRAWWAQGLKPIILTPSEARNNPTYQQVQHLKLPAGVELEVMRWLAWESMGTGILCHHLVLPMGDFGDELLSYFRRGTFPELRRFEGMSNTLFSGPKSSVTKVLKEALALADLKASPDLHTFVTQDNFRIDPAPAGVAMYDTRSLQGKYSKVAEAIVTTPGAGLRQLNDLINAHLHNTWQNHFAKGISVLKPLMEHSYAIVEPALTLAHYLANCPTSPILSSCPPNRPKCRPCVASAPMQIETIPQYRNLSTQYIIGIVPHPYTTATLPSMSSIISVASIRRTTERDAWLSMATRELLGTGVSSVKRVTAIKSAIATPYSIAHSLWFTAERPLPEDLDWHFGFRIPRNATNDGKSETPVPGPERRPKAPPPDYGQGPLPSKDELQHERDMLQLAIGKTEGSRSNGNIIGWRKDKTKDEERRVLDACEAWSLADKEIWQFAGAFAARRVTERRVWEQEEAKFGGGLGREKRNRWWD